MEYKKVFMILGAFIAVVFGPMIVLSTPMMGCYQRKIDENPNTESARNWQFRLAGWCAKTGRYELAAEMYGKFIDRYEKDERRPEAMFRRGHAFRDAENNISCKETWKILIRDYPETQQAKDADEMLKLQYNDYERLQ